MSDILNFLRAYPDDPAAVMSRARVAETIAEIDRLRAELAAATKRIKLEEMNADAWKTEYEKTRSDLAAAMVRVKDLEDESEAMVIKVCAASDAEAEIHAERDALRAELAAEREKAFTAMRVFERYRELEAQVAAAEAERDELRAKCDELETDISELGSLADARCAEKEIVEDQLRAVRHARLRLRVALELIADTDPDEGTAWFHSVANAALKGDDRD